MLYLYSTPSLMLIAFFFVSAALWASRVMDLPDGKVGDISCRNWTVIYAKECQNK